MKKCRSIRHSIHHWYGNFCTNLIIRNYISVEDTRKIGKQCEIQRNLQGGTGECVVKHLYRFFIFVRIVLYLKLQFYLQSIDYSHFHFIFLGDFLETRLSFFTGSAFNLFGNFSFNFISTVPESYIEIQSLFCILL